MNPVQLKLVHKNPKYSKESKEFTKIQVNSKEFNELP